MGTLRDRCGTCGAAAYAPCEGFECADFLWQRPMRADERQELGMSLCKAGKERQKAMDADRSPFADERSKGVQS